MNINQSQIQGWGGRCHVYQQQQQHMKRGGEGKPNPNVTFLPVEISEPPQILLEL